MFEILLGQLPPSKSFFVRTKSFKDGASSLRQNEPFIMTVIAVCPSPTTQKTPSTSHCPSPPPCVTISTTIRKDRTRDNNRGFGFFAGRKQLLRLDISATSDRIVGRRKGGGGGGDNDSNTTLGTMKTTTTAATTTTAGSRNPNDTSYDSTKERKKPRSRSVKKSKLFDFFTRVGENRNSNVVRKNKDTQRRHDTVFFGGVYIVSSTKTTTTATTTTTNGPPESSPGVLVRTASCRTIDTRASSSADDGSVSAATTTTTTTAAWGWSPSDGPEFHMGSPVIGRRPSDADVNPRLAGLDDHGMLSHVLFEARTLPRTPGPYASAHVLINSERLKRMIQPLRRCPAMDEIARRQAGVMAVAQTLQHTNDPGQLQDEIIDVIDKVENNHNNESRHQSGGDEQQHQRRFYSGRHADDGQKRHRIGENVGRGKTINEIHSMMMMTTNSKNKNKNNVSQRNNILHRRFVYMGVGTAKGDDGLLYLCQIFSS